MNNGHCAALLKSNNNNNNRTPSFLSSYQSMLDSETESTRTHPSPEGGELLQSSTTIASMNNYSVWKLLSCCHLPPSFNYPTNEANNSGNTRPFYLFPIFVAFNIFTMTDRAIIPGANVQFVNFIQHAYDSPEFAKNNPDAGIGLVNGKCISRRGLVQPIIIFVVEHLIRHSSRISTTNLFCCCGTSYSTFVED